MFGEESVPSFCGRGGSSFKFTLSSFDCSCCDNTAMSLSRVSPDIVSPVLRHCATGGLSGGFRRSQNMNGCLGTALPFKATATKKAFVLSRWNILLQSRYKMSNSCVRVASRLPCVHTRTRAKWLWFSGFYDKLAWCQFFGVRSCSNGFWKIVKCLQVCWFLRPFGLVSNVRREIL